MDKVELIRHEIEKRRVHNLAIGNPLFAVKAEEDIELLSFIDSLQKEPISEELEEAANNTVISLIPSFGQKNSDGSYVSSYRDCFKREEFINLFMAGAKWQKEKTLKESEDAIQYVKENHSPSEVRDFQNAMNISVMKAFDAGKEKMREQMMANAIDAEVLENYDGKVIEYDETILDKKLSNYKVFDKVKVIVVKEEKL